MNTKSKGNVGEAFILAEFTKYGVQCSLPWGDNARYDLIAEFNGKLNKIQIKYCDFISENDSYICTLVSSTNHTTNKKLHEYINDVDYMAFYIKQLNKCLLVPIEFCKEKRSIRFRCSPTKNHQKKGINLIDDFTFDKILCVETLHDQPKP